MVWLNKIEYNNKLFQVFIDEKQNRIILEIKNSSSYYYMYPEFCDLLAITKKYFTMDSIVYEDSSSNFKNKFINISQKVLIAGITISIVLNIPILTKTYALETAQNIYTEAFEILPNAIYKVEELNEIFDAHEITKNDVHKAIDENYKITKYKDIIHEYVDDIYNIRPNQNWWIFYQNIRRMEINETSLDDISGNFDFKTSKIKISNTLDTEYFKVVLRHELTHALSLINIKIDNKIVVMHYYNNVSGYGRSIMEMLTSSFNSYTGKGEDLGYERYKKIFEPLKIQLGTKQFTDTLFTGNINYFIEQNKPYYENIDEYISYLDAIFYCNDSGDWRNKRNVDKDFLMKFNTMTMEFFLTLSHEQLKEGIISPEFYLNNKLYYISNLHNMVNDILEKYSIEKISVSQQYKIFAELEKNIFDFETLKSLENTYNNKNLMITLFNNNNNLDLKIQPLYEFNSPINFYTDENNLDNIYDFYFLIENQRFTNKLKLRLINKNNPEYNNIDLLTNEYIDDNNEIICIVPVLDYIKSIPRDKFENGKIASTEYFVSFKDSFFSVDDILQYNNSNKIKKSNY